jgi:hypothetical protein
MSGSVRLISVIIEKIVAKFLPLLHIIVRVAIEEIGVKFLALLHICQQVTLINLSIVMSTHRNVSRWFLAWGTQ